MPTLTYEPRDPERLAKWMPGYIVCLPEERMTWVSAPRDLVEQVRIETERAIYQMIHGKPRKI